MKKSFAIPVSGIINKGIPMYIIGDIISETSVCLSEYGDSGGFVAGSFVVNRSAEGRWYLVKSGSEYRFSELVEGEMLSNILV